MSNDALDTGRAKAYLESLTGQLSKLIQEGPQVAQEAASLTATETSPDGLITVTVDTRGSMIDLRLDSRIYRQPDSEALAEAIVATTRRAAETVKNMVLDRFEQFGDRAQFEMVLNGDVEDFSTDLQDRMTNWKA